MAKFKVVFTVRDDFGMTKQIPAGEVELTYDQLGDEVKQEISKVIQNTAADITRDTMASELPTVLQEQNIKNTIVNIVEESADALQYSDFDTED